MSEEELREKLAKRLGVDAQEIGGGYEFGQFWDGPNEYSIEEVKQINA